MTEPDKVSAQSLANLQTQIWGVWNIVTNWPPDQFVPLANQINAVLVAANEPLSVVNPLIAQLKGLIDNAQAVRGYVGPPLPAIDFLTPGDPTPPVPTEPGSASKQSIMNLQTQITELLSVLSSSPPSGPVGQLEIQVYLVLTAVNGPLSAVNPRIAQLNGCINDFQALLGKPLPTIQALTSGNPTSAVPTEPGSASKQSIMNLQIQLRDLWDALSNMDNLGPYELAQLEYQTNSVLLALNEPLSVVNPLIAQLNDLINNIRSTVGNGNPPLPTIQPLTPAIP